MSLPIKEFRTLHRFVDQIFDEAYTLDMSWNELAIKANLAPTTVYNLGNYDTMYPRASTVFALAKAVGFDIALVKKNFDKKRIKLKVA